MRVFLNKTIQKFLIEVIYYFQRHFDSKYYWVQYSLIYTNMAIAFRENFTVEQYENFVKEILKNRIRGELEFRENKKINYVGYWNYFKMYIKSGLGNSDKTFLKNISEKMQRKMDLIRNDPQKRWKEFCRYFHKYKIENLDVVEEALKEGNGVAVCSFHFGQFRVLLELLSAKGYKVNLLVDEQYLTHNYAEREKLLKNKENLNSGKNHKFILANDPRAIIRISKALKKNEIILFFLDGNLGLGDKKRTEIVPFFSQYLYARKGALQIALMNKTPIVPMISRWNKFDNAEYKFFNKIEVDYNASLKESTSSLTKSLYSFFINFISEEPAQWEQWKNCHHFWVKPDKSLKEISVEQYDETKEKIRNMITPAKKNKIMLDKSKVGYFIDKNEQLILVDIKTIKVFDVEAAIRDIVLTLYKNPLSLKALVKKISRKYNKEQITEALTKLDVFDYLLIN